MRATKPTVAERILDGSCTDSPWGEIQGYPEDYGPGIVGVNTPGHGGIRIDAPALGQVPTAVRKSLMNGSHWAEEDVEMAIVLAFFIPDREELISRHLPMAGRRDEDGENALVSHARRLAEKYPNYQAALKHLPKPAKSQKALL